MQDFSIKNNESTFRYQNNELNMAVSKPLFAKHKNIRAPAIILTVN